MAANVSSALRGQSRRQCMKAALQGDLYAVSQECDEDMSLDASLVVVEHRTDRQVTRQIFERLFHGGKLNGVLPQQGGIGPAAVGT
jgi:hypothetical protein